MSDTTSSLPRTYRSATDRAVILQGLAAVGLVGMAIVHLVDSPDKFAETPYVGVLFLALIAASLVIAELIVRGSGSPAWIAGAGLAAATILGYVVSRTIGLPGAPEDDLGNWLEPLGMVSLLVEAIVVWVCLTGWLSARRR
jgi:hypothetical protein